MATSTVPALQGTEKQIAWANEIRERVLRDLEAYLNGENVNLGEGFAHFDYRDDEEPHSETIIQRPTPGGWLRSPERETERECPDCGSRLIYYPVDGVYWCRTCMREWDHA